MQISADGYMAERDDGRLIHIDYFHVATDGKITPMQIDVQAMVVREIACRRVVPASHLMANLTKRGLLAG